MCEVLGVSRSGYYAWLKKPESPRDKKRKKLAKHILETFLKSRRLYGSPKITQALKAQGIVVSQKTVSRIMQEQNLRSRTVKKHKVITTNSKHSLPVHDNLLNQQFLASAPNEVWMADITYVPTQEGWLYVASIMDLYTRKIVGWHAGERLKKELVIQALDQAHGRQQPESGVLHHSDRGSQYASHAYQDQLALYGMTSSMSRKGNCYDNACIESFHSILKKELVYLETFQTRKQAKRRVFEFIECFYNHERIHSSIDYLSPSAYEHQYYKQTKEAA